MIRLFLGFRSWLVISLVCLACFCRADDAVHIVVNQGPFASVLSAASGEENVNFFDADFSDERAVTECYAAVELQTYFAKVSTYAEEEIVFRSGTTLPKKGDVFILGSVDSNPLIAQLADPVSFETDQSYRISSFQQNGRTITLIEGAGHVGTLYGVYRYLEGLGVKFIGLGEVGTVLPAQPVVAPAALQLIENPSYLSRGYWAWGDRNCDREFFVWMARNRMNFWTAENQPARFLKKLGIKLTDGGHAIQRWFINPQSAYPYRHQAFASSHALPADPYPVSAEYLGDENTNGVLSYCEAHPEWFCLKDGKRSKTYKDKTGDNFCTSNADARQELAKNMVQALIDGKWKFVDVVNFWMSDYGHWCECDVCKADGTETDRLFTVVNTILNEVKTARKAGRLNRQVEISAIAYAETLAPPTKPLPADFDYPNSSVTFFPIRRCFAHPFADPKCSEINQSQLELYEGWTVGDDRHYNGSMFIGEYYNISKFKSLPVALPAIIGTDVPWYYENGARHFHYMHVPTRLWGTWSMNQYLLSKMLWNVQANPEKVLTGYYEDFYPTTKETVAQMVTQLEIASANLKILKHDVGTPWHFNLANNFLKGDMFQLEHFEYETPKDADPNRPNAAPSMVEVMSASTRAKELVQTALKQCSDPTERKRLLEDQRRVDYGYNMSMYLYHIVRTAMFHQEQETDKAKQEFSQLQRYAEELKKVTDLVQVAGKDANSPNGFIAAHSTRQYKAFKKLYGASPSNIFLKFTLQF